MLVEESPPSAATTSLAVRSVHLHQNQGLRTVDTLPAETALEVIVNDRPYGLLMQTPGNERELVTGFLYTEGLIDRHADIALIEITSGPEFLGQSGRQARVVLPAWTGTQSFPERPALAATSCGLCGKQDLATLGRGLGRLRGHQAYDWRVLIGLLDDLKNHQPLYALTRGVHAVALYRADGTFMCCFEDVGRHNALDKAIGFTLAQGWSFGDTVAVLSGRASLEMILKTVRAAIPLLLCFSRPSVLAVESAKVLNLTLAGRIRPRSLAVYTHSRRINFPESWLSSDHAASSQDKTQDKG